MFTRTGAECNHREVGEVNFLTVKKVYIVLSVQTSVTALEYLIWLLCN